MEGMEMGLMVRVEEREGVEMVVEVIEQVVERRIEPLVVVEISICGSGPVLGTSISLFPEFGCAPQEFFVPECSESFGS